jgi:hypothetical protein
MSRGSPHPWRGSEPSAAEFDLLLIDGDNLLHRVRGSRDEAGLRWLLPRLRAWLPAGAHIIVMLDGHPDPGEVLRRRVAPGIAFQHSGSVDADTALLTILAARPYADRARTLLVTDDRGLTDRARHGGGLTRRLDWLTVQLARATGLPGAGQSGRGIGPGPSSAEPPASRQSARGMAEGRGPGAGPPIGIGRGRSVRKCESRSEPNEDRDAWRPGRGATRKVGNPKRGHPS